jgi:drug/metabolite transporter (DMT)-like permease
MQRLLGVFLVLLSATSFGAMPIFAHFAYAANANPITILFLRFAIAAICLLIFLAVQRIPFPRGRNLLSLIVIGSVGFVLQSICYFTALTLAPASLVGLLLYLYPVIVTILSITLLKEPSNRPKLIALGIAFTGLVLTIGPELGGQVLGVLLGLASAMVYASYVIAGSSIMQKEEPLPACTVMIASAAIVFGGLILVQGAEFPETGEGWLAIGAIAIISTVLSIITLFAGMKWIGATNASTLSTWEPVMTVILAAMILGETITLFRIVGGLLILAAVIVLAKQELQLPARHSSILANVSDPLLDHPES